MPTIPVPVFDDTHHYITYDDDPLTKIKSVALDLTGSLVSDGGSAISKYKTVIAWQPAGQSAAVTSSTTSAPVIDNIDASIPGTIVVFAAVEDDNANPTLKKSYDSIQPRQNGASSNFGRGAYAGVGPVPTQIAYISVETPTGLLKHGRFQREWLELPGGLNDLVDRVDSLTTQVAALGTDGRFDDLYEKTAAHGIDVHNNVQMLSGSLLRFKNSTDGPSDYTYIDNNFDASTGFYLASSPGKDIKFWRSDGTASLWVNVDLANGYMSVLGGNGATLGIRSYGVEAYDPNGSVTLRGRGTHIADVRVDSIQRDTLNGAVEIFGSGTRTADIRTGGIEPLLDNSAVQIVGRGTHDADARIDVIQPSSNNSYVHLKKRGSNSYDARVDDLLCNNINGIPYYAKPYFIYNKSDYHQTTGTVAELVLDETVPAGALLVEGAGYMEITFNTLCANNGNDKEVTLEIDDGVNAVVTPISALFNTTGTYTTWTCRLAAAGGANWNVSTEIAPQGANVTAAGLTALQVLSWSLPWAVRVYIQSPDATGDITYVCGSILVAPGVVPPP